MPSSATTCIHWPSPFLGTAVTSMSDPTMISTHWLSNASCHVLDFTASLPVAEFCAEVILCSSDVHHPGRCHTGCGSPHQFGSCNRSLVAGEGTYAGGHAQNPEGSVWGRVGEHVRCVCEPHNIPEMGQNVPKATTSHSLGQYGSAGSASGTPILSASRLYSQKGAAKQ